MGWMTEQQKQDLCNEIEKKMDHDQSRRFFKHIYRREEFNHLDFPHINMPKTLTTLINVCYASSLTPTKDSDSSSQTSNNPSHKEWLEVFDGDGHLRFNQILSLFPPSRDMDASDLHMYRQCLCHAHFAVLSYNETHGAEYELVAPIMSYVFLSMEPVISYLSYVNFLAKPKNSDSSPDLFFAKMVATGRQANEVLECCILEPRSSPVAMTLASVDFWLPAGEQPDPGCYVESCC